MYAPAGVGSNVVLLSNINFGQTDSCVSEVFVGSCAQCVFSVLFAYFYHSLLVYQQCDDCSGCGHQLCVYNDNRTCVVRVVESSDNCEYFSCVVLVRWPCIVRRAPSQLTDVKLYVYGPAGVSSNVVLLSNINFGQTDSCVSEVFVGSCEQCVFSVLFAYLYHSPLVYQHCDD